MLSAIILARTLDTSSFAAYSYFQLTISMLASYTAMGLGISASRYFSELNHEIDNREPPPIGTLWMLSIAFTTGAFALIMLMPNLWLTAGLLVPKWLLALGVFSLGLTVVPSGAILGLERYKQATLISGFSGTTMILVVWWASHRNLPIIAMGAIVLSTLMQALGESTVVIRTVGWKKISNGFRLRRHEIRRVFEFAGPMFLVTLISASGSWLLGRMILRSDGGELTFARYVIGLQWFSLGLLLPGTISRVILPRLVRNKSIATSEASNQRLVLQGATMATVSALLLAVLGSIFSPWILSIYGAKYESERWLIAAFLGAAVLSAPTNTLGNAIVASNGQNIWLKLTVFWLMVLLISGHIAMPFGAFAGAAAQASAALALTLTAISVLRAKR